MYTAEQFRRRFRMRRNLFLRIVEALGNHSTYFQITQDAIGRTSLSPLQKCTAAIRMLAYGSPADSVDEYVRMGERTTHDCLKNFVVGINEVFGAEYLRKPNVDDTERLLRIGEARGFPGMIGSIDCMHWEWKNCPTAWKGQFTRGDHGKPTIMLEAVASHDLWIWHAFFGTPGANNDINVLNRSPVFNDVLSNNAPQVKFTINGTEYTTGYYLADGIYPDWPTFVKSISMPQGSKKQLFAKRQESCRKDVERAFGVLQARFSIVTGPGRQWEMNTLKDIMYACIILHNMIIEDERDTFNTSDYTYDSNSGEPPTVVASQGPHPDLAAYLQRSSTLHSKLKHYQLQNDLIEHVWQRFGDVENDV